MLKLKNKSVLKLIEPLFHKTTTDAIVLFLLFNQAGFFREFSDF